MSWMWSFVRPAAAPGAPDAQRTRHADEATRLADEFIESYILWREQCAEVESAYDRWTSGREESAVAFEIYRAELELEEHAAGTYRESAERLALATGPETS